MAYCNNSCGNRFSLRVSQPGKTVLWVASASHNTVLKVTPIAFLSFLNVVKIIVCAFEVLCHTDCDFATKEMAPINKKQKTHLFKKVLYLHQQTECNIKKAYVLSNEQKVYTKNGITYIPIYYIMFFHLKL